MILGVKSNNGKNILFKALRKASGFDSAVGRWIRMDFFKGSFCFFKEIWRYRRAHTNVFSKQIKYDSIRITKKRYVVIVCTGIWDAVCY